MTNPSTTRHWLVLWLLLLATWGFAPSQQQYYEKFSSDGSMDIPATDILYTPVGNTAFSMCVYNNAAGPLRHVFGTGDLSRSVYNLGGSGSATYNFASYGSFQYLGNSYTSVTIFADGYIALGSNMIDGYYTNLHAQNGVVSAWIEKTSATNSVVISYNNICYYGTFGGCSTTFHTDKISFQIELRLDTGKFLITTPSSVPSFKGDIGLNYGSSIDLSGLKTAPTLTVSVGTATKSTLSVSFTSIPAPYVQSYFVECKRSSDSAIVWSDTVTSTSATATGLAPATSYYFAVRNTCEKWDGTTHTYSASSSSSIKSTLPEPPTNLEGTATTDSITFTWSGKTGVRYKCELSPGGKIQYSEGKSTTFSLLNSFTVYTVKIYSGFGNEFETDFAALAISTKPTPVTNIHPSTLDYHSATIEWIPVNGNRFEVVLRDGSQTVASQSSITGNSYTFNDLVADKTYSVIVYAGSETTGYENVGKSALFTTLPSGVNDLSVTDREGTKLVFGWTPITGAEYKVILIGGKEQVVSSPSMTFTNLSVGTTYIIYVHPGKDGFFSSSYSEISGTTYGSPATNVRLTTSTSDSLTFAWDAPLGAISYNLVLTGGNDPYFVNDIETTTHSFINLSPYTEYTLHVYAGFNEGKVYETTGASISKYTLVGVVYDVDTTEVDTNSLSFEWTLPHGASKSKLLLQDGLEQYPRELDNGANAATFYGLLNYTEYTLTIHAANEDQDYESAGYQGTFWTLPAATSSITVNDVQSNSISISWEGVEGANIYRVSIDSVPPQVTETGATEITFSGLVEFVQYTIIVQSGIQSLGFGSLGKSITQMTSTSIVGNLQCVPSQYALLFSWSAAGNATQYKLILNGDNEKETAALSFNFESLNAGSLYQLRIYSGYPDYDENYASIDCYTIPEAPKDLVVDFVSASAIMVKWTESPGALVYKATLTAAGKSPQTITTSGNTAYFSGLAGGAEYTIKVQAGRGGIYEDTGDQISTFTLPPAVTNILVQNRTSNSLTFQWDAALTAIYYNVVLYKTVVGGDFVEETVTEPEVQFDGLASATRYILYVYSASGLGKNSNGATFSAVTLPLPPGNVITELITSNSAKVTWSSVSASRYKVRWSAGMSSNEKLVSGTQSTTLTGLQPGTTYDVTVFSGDATDFELVGKKASFLTRPSAVGELTCSQLTTTTFTLSWEKVNGATTYLAEIVGKAAMDQTANSKVFNNLTPATAYSVVVYAGNEGGFENVGTYGSCSTVTAPPSSLIKTLSTSTSLSLQWGQVTSANMYRVQLFKDDNVFDTKDLSNINIYTFTGLSPDTHYTCKVYAGIINVGYEGVGRSLSDADVRTTPRSPDNVDIAFYTSTSMDVEWDASAGATGYHVELFLEEDLRSVDDLGPVTNHTFEGLLPFSNYTVVVKAMNVGGTEPVGTTVSQRTYPAVVSNLDSVSPTPKSIRVTWEIFPNTFFCKVQLLSSDGNTEIDSEFVEVSVGEMDVTFSGLSANTQYVIRVFSGVEANDFNSLYAEVSQYTISEPLQSVSVAAATSTSITFEMELTDGTTGILVNFLNGTNREVINTDFITTFSPLSRRTTYLYGTVDNLLPATEYYMELFTISAGGTGDTGIFSQFSTFPSQVSGFVGKGVDGKSIAFTWVPPLNIHDNVVYKISHFDEDMVYLGSEGNIDNTTFLFDGLLADKEYKFQIFVCTTESQSPDCSSEGPLISVNTNSFVCTFRKEYFATWHEISSGNPQYGVCDEGYIGEPSRFCDSSLGTWGPVTGNCVKIASPVTSIMKEEFYNEVILQWKPATAATQYKILITDFNSNNPEIANDGKAVNITGKSYTITGLELRTAYYGIIYAGNEGGYEETGFSFNITTTLQPPLNLKKSTVEMTKVSIEWTPTVGTECYSIYVKKEGENSKGVVPCNYHNQYTVQNLSPGTKYTITVHSVVSVPYYEEPYGSSIEVETLKQDASVGTGNNNIAVYAGLAAGIVLFLLIIIIIIVLFVRKQKQRQREFQKTLEMAPLQAMIMDGRSGTFDMRSMQTIPIPEKTKMTAKIGDATVLNTLMEVAVPGFLRLNMMTQLRIIGPLGSGGGGTIFKAELIDPKLKDQHRTQFAVVKQVFEMPYLTKEENMQRFLQEVSIMWSVTFHKNVVKLFGYAEEPNMAIVTKFYEMDLATYLRTPTNFIPAPLILYLSRGIADGMSAINNCGIVHRDLKSQNILLERIPVEPYINPIICDFGLARVFREVTLQSQTFVAVKGISVAYAAPEVFERLRTNTVAADLISEVKSDMFSMGVIIWEMFMRVAPWSGVSVKEIQENVVNGKRLSLPETTGKDPITKGLCTIIEECWQQDPNARPTFEQLVKKLF